VEVSVVRKNFLKSLPEKFHPEITGHTALNQEINRNSGSVRYGYRQFNTRRFGDGTNFEAIRMTYKE